MILQKWICSDNNRKKILNYLKEKIVNLDNKNINTFEFDQIDFNLADYSTNSILFQNMKCHHKLN